MTNNITEIQSFEFESQSDGKLTYFREDLPEIVLGRSSCGGKFSIIFFVDFYDMYIQLVLAFYQE